MRRSKDKFICTLLLLLATLSVHANHLDKSAGWHELNIEHDNLQRYFRIYIPQNLASTPDLVLLFHGGTQSMRKIFRKRAGGTQQWEQLANENGFLLLTPNGINIRNGDTEGDRQNWNDCRVAVAADNSASTADDAGFVRALISWAKAQFDINESRVYTTGASNGGMMSLRLVTELGDKIAAAAVFIANQPVESDCSEPAYKVPLFMMSGTDDPLVLWGGGQIRDKGPVLMSAPATRDFWIKVNHADKAGVETELLPDVNSKDNSAIIRTIYPAHPGGQPLWFYEVRGGGHTMPSLKYDVPFLARVLVGHQNRDIEAADEAWKFLKQFTKE